MTRETKIGLLVGLGFIIVIGILLSDHIQSSTEPPAAQLSIAAPNVRNAINSPNSNPTVATDVTAPDNVAPPQPVVTQEELTNKPKVLDLVKIGPSNDQPIEIKAINPEVARNNNDANIPAGLDATHRKDEKIALVPVTPDADTTPQPAQPQVKMTVYKAVAGDSLARITKKVYGMDSSANRALIVSANKELKGSAPKIVIGHAYNIPAKSTDSPAIASYKTGPTTMPSAKSASTSSLTTTYTVKDGDTLSKIAKKEFGSISAIAQIRELNRDVLKSDTQLKPNMKLKLPAKNAVASAE